MPLFPRRRRPDAPCRCGHTRSAHEHLRAGTDCALGERGHCTHFRAAHARRPADLLRRRRQRADEPLAGPGAPVVRIPDPARVTSPAQRSPRRRTSA